MKLGKDVFILFEAEKGEECDTVLQRLRRAKAAALAEIRAAAVPDFPVGP